MVNASIIIPCFNNAHLTLECVQSVISYTPDHIEIIIVDDHSEKQQLEELLKKIPDNQRKLAIYPSQTNKGFSSACNRGAKFAQRKSKILIFLNNDAVITKNWFSGFEKYMAGNGVCGSKLLYPEDKYSHIHGRSIQKGTIQHAGIVVENMMPVHKNRFEKSEKSDKSMTFPFVTGASFAIWKDLFEDLKGFSESYMNGCEDLDLCIRVRNRGLNIAYSNESVAFHHETATRNPETSAQNLKLFLEEHKSQLEKDTDFVHQELV